MPKFYKLSQQTPPVAAAKKPGKKSFFLQPIQITAPYNDTKIASLSPKKKFQSLKGIWKNELSHCKSSKLKIKLLFLFSLPSHSPNEKKTGCNNNRIIYLIYFEWLSSCENINACEPQFISTAWR